MEEGDVVPNKAVEVIRTLWEKVIGPLWDNSVTIISLATNNRSSVNTEAVTLIIPVGVVDEALNIILQLSLVEILNKVRGVPSSINNEVPNEGVRVLFSKSLCDAVQVLSADALNTYEVL